MMINFKKIAATTLVVGALGVGAADVARNDLNCEPSLYAKAGLSKSVEKRIHENPSLDRKNTKGCEIANLDPVGTYKRKNYTIEITKIEKIDGGVQIFARVWDKKKQQIGFGKDGTIDIERFRIFNPPILVDDADGDIIRESIKKDGAVERRKLKEDLAEALLQSLEQTIDVKQQKFGPDSIVAGKVGNTTSTFYPDANPESTSVDGYVSRESVSETWADIRANAGNAKDDTDQQGWFFFTGHATAGTFASNRRGIFVFDTSAIGSDTVDSAVFSLYVNSKSDNAGGGGNTPALVLAQYASSATTALANSDYDIANHGTTRLASDIAYSSITTTAYNDMTLNVDGIANINGSGLSKFSTLSDNDFDNSAPTTVSLAAFDTVFGAIGFTADRTGTTSDPKLVVEHSASANRRIIITE